MQFKGLPKYLCYTYSLHSHLLCCYAPAKVFFNYASIITISNKTKVPLSVLLMLKNMIDFPYVLHLHEDHLLFDRITNINFAIFLYRQFLSSRQGNFIH